MQQKDYYKVMGVPDTATEKDIKMAYRRLARKYHPDISKEKDAEEHFKEVGEAYEVLKDPEKRKTYDEYLRYGGPAQQAPRSGNRESHGFGAESPFPPDFDFFESLFGARSPREHVHAGRDIHASLQVSLEEAYHGGTKEIQLSGAQGAQHQPQTLRVKIPAGVRQGQQIRLAGQGAQGQYNRGDLYITLNIEKHPLFDVMGDDIYITLPVAPWEVALGATVPVPTLAGKVDLKIPPGSQGGQKLRLKHRGLKSTTMGDQYVILKILTPKPTTDAARALYQKMAEEMPLNPRAQMGV